MKTRVSFKYFVTYCRLTNWQFADKSSWGKDIKKKLKILKISLLFDTNLGKWNSLIFKIWDISLHIFIASVLLENKSKTFSM